MPTNRIYKVESREAYLKLVKGTRWLSYWRSSYIPNRYPSRGPLYVIYTNTGAKFLLHLACNLILDKNNYNHNVINFKKKYPWVFDRIKFSTEEELIGIKYNSYAIEYFNNPSEVVQMAVVKQSGYSIKHIKNPSEIVQIAAIKEDGYAIRHIHSPSEAVQMEAVKGFGPTIQWIKNPSEAIQLAAVKQNGRTIKLIKNPSEKIQLAAVTQNPYAITAIKNPSEIVQIAAVRGDPEVIKYIKRPSALVKFAITIKSELALRKKSVFVQSAYDAYKLAVALAGEQDVNDLE